MAIIRAHPAHFAAALGTAAFQLLERGASDVALVTEAIRLLDELATIAPQPAAVLSHTIPLLLSCLDGPHSPLALTELTALGAKFPQDFRGIIAACSEEQRTRLTTAVRAAASAASALAAGPTVVKQAPSIQLKMDFSAFGK